jgi:rhamnulokinase
MSKEKGKNYIIADFGASNGRVSVGNYNPDKGTFNIETVHRFDNSQVLLNGRYYWDILRLFSELKTGIRIAAGKYKKITSIGIDAWGLDFAFIDKNGKIMSNPLTYRDPGKSKRDASKLFKNITEKEFFNLTGCFTTSLAAAFYLEKLASENDWELMNAHKILPLSDLFNYLLSGRFAVEYSRAYNMLLVNCVSKNWENIIIQEAGFPEKILPAIIDSGQKIGNISEKVAKELDIKPFSVASVAGHDTASAVAAFPSVSGKYDYAFLSTGTWLVLGAETEAPVLEFDATRHLFTNEGGALKSNFFAKDISGFWIIQRCVDRWQKEEGAKIPWKEIDALFIKEEPFSSIINTQDEVFLKNSENMPAAIIDYCRDNKIKEPSSKGQFARCIYESLVLCVKHYFNLLQFYCNMRFLRIHITGGGVNNAFFCQWIADALGIEVVAGPVEATTAGNLLMQLKADNEISSIKEGRVICLNSHNIEIYQPINPGIWEQQYNKYARFFNLLY